MKVKKTIKIIETYKEELIKDIEIQLALLTLEPMSMKYMQKLNRKVREYMDLTREQMLLLDMEENGDV